MDQSDIHVFVEVVDAQSFAKAASRLRMPPATVSLKIARLEKRLGATLIHRTTRKLSVTPAGENYYTHCVRALNELREARRKLAAASDEPSGRLRLTTTPGIAHSFLPHIIDRYVDRYPHVNFELILTNNMVDIVAEGIDLAFRLGHKQLADSSLIARKLLLVRYGLWTSEAYIEKHGAPKSLEDLAEHSFVGPRLPDWANEFLKANRKKLKLSSPRIETDDFQTIRHFLAGGKGIGFLPNPIGHGSKLVRLFPDFRGIERTVYMVYPAQKFIPLTVRKFIDCALDYFKPEDGGPRKAQNGESCDASSQFLN